jgi:hypothetical protein
MQARDNRIPRPNPSRKTRRPKEKCRSCYSGCLQQFLLTVAAVAFLALTIAYASKDLFSIIPFAYSSSSNTIFVLSLLAHTTGSLLFITFDSTLGLIRWLLIARDGGVPFANFLALAPGTGIFGLLRLGLGCRVRASARLWGIICLVTSLLPPIVGVLIMSKITSAYFAFKAENSRPCEHSHDP